MLRHPGCNNGNKEQVGKNRPGLAEVERNHHKKKNTDA